MNITMPFIIIFGLLLSFIKLDRDKEILAIFSLGLSIDQIRRPLVLICFFFTLLYLFLNLFFSPYIYEKYKIKEFELRNLINLSKINSSNFIKLDSKIILDFKKEDNIFKDILINYIEEGDNIIFAKTGNIEKNADNIFTFNLISGFKLNIIKNEIEKLEFENYKIEFPIQVKNKYDNFDRNTQTIFNSIKNKDYKNIFDKFFDILILLSIIIFFYFYIIKKNDFRINNILKFLSFSLLILIFQNIYKNINIDLQLFLILNLINFVLIIMLITVKKYNIL